MYVISSVTRAPPTWPTVKVFRTNFTQTSNTAACEQSQRDHKLRKSLMADHRKRLIRRRCKHCYGRNGAAGLSA